MSIRISERRQIIQEFLDWHEDQASGTPLAQALAIYVEKMQANATEQTLHAVKELAAQGASSAEILDYIEGAR